MSYFRKIAFIYHVVKLKLLTEWKIIFSSKLNVSVGENCLTDNILSRHNIKSFTTIYSHGRSNLDYAILLEKDGYQNILDNKYLYYAYFEKKKVVRNSYYKLSSDIYHENQTNGFEFTYHDLLSSSSSAKKSATRKLKRLTRLAGKKNFRFFYHYRISDKFDLNEIFKKAQLFLNFYTTTKVFKNEFIIFSQVLVKTEDERGLNRVNFSSNICCYLFKTTQVWEGEEGDLFWAKKDDDLIKKMISDIFNKKPNSYELNDGFRVTKII